LTAIGMGTSWIKAKQGDCRVDFYSRTFEISFCPQRTVKPYYKCDESYCQRCEEAGEAMLVFGVFGIIAAVIASLFAFKRTLNDEPKDWASRNMRQVTTAVFVLVSVFFCLSWMSFIGGCEDALGDFTERDPHTGFVLVFFAMISAAIGAVCSLFAPTSSRNRTEEEANLDLAEQEIEADDAGDVDDVIGESEIKADESNETEEKKVGVSDV